jgi:periplasmic divalent cation tolerance protein
MVASGIIDRDQDSGAEASVPVRTRYRAGMSPPAPAPTHVVVQVTTGSRDEAERIARTLVERRLAASGQVGPLRTWYRWQGRVHEAEEHRVSLFTRRDRFEAVACAVRELHGYALPQIVAVPLVDGTPEFLRWIDESCAALGPDDPA